MRSEQAPRESLFSVARAEPERAKLLLQVVAGGAVAMAAWSWAGAMLFGDLIFLPLTLLLTAVYSLAVVVLAGDLVRHADRWQVDSALQARRLMSTGAGAVPAARGSATAAGANPASFDHWYFVLRLDDEIKRARRQGSQVSVVMMKVTAPGGETSPAVTEQISFDMATMAANHAQTMTMPSAISAQEYAFLLPGTDRDEAKARIAPLLNPLGGYWCQFGIAVYPDDGTDAEALVHIARAQVDEEKERSAA